MRRISAKNLAFLVTIAVLIPAGFPQQAFCEDACQGKAYETVGFDSLYAQKGAAVPATLKPNFPEKCLHVTEASYADVLIDEKIALVKKNLKLEEKAVVFAITSKMASEGSPELIVVGPSSLQDTLKKLNLFQPIEAKGILKQTPKELKSLHSFAILYATEIIGK